MAEYAIIETDAGLTIVELPPGATPEDVAATRAGVVIDPGPYREYDDAYDALLATGDDEEDEYPP